MTNEAMKMKLEFHRSAVTKLRAAYLAIAEGGAASYSIGSRSISKHDLSKITAEIAEHEKQIANIEAAMQNGGKRRRAVGVVIRDW